MTMRSGGLAATVTRSFALDDIRRSKTGDGRTVEAYAAVFDNPVEITDQDGHYNEQIGRAAFNRTLSHRGTAFGVFYNHGRTLYGTPSDRATVPLGTPLEVKADSRGLYTVTRYNKTPLADDVLESIDNGDIRGQSFTGRMRRSTPERGPFRARNGELTLVTRQEIELIEYGPTPFPAYTDAAIVGRRSATVESTLGLVELLLATDESAARMAEILAADELRDRAHEILSDLAAMNDMHSNEADDLDRAAFLARLRSLAGTLEPDSGTSDPDRASADASDAENVVAHSAPKLTRAQIRARLYRIEVL